MKLIYRFSRVCGHRSLFALCLFGLSAVANALPVSFSEDLALPKILDSEKVVMRPGYSVVYNQEHKNPRWVAYVLTKDEVNARWVSRTNEFHTDFAFGEPTATPEDYKGSGYQRGHLTPARDNEWSLTAMTDSFFMSNISPMKMSYNLGIWVQLERKVRSLAKTYGELFVATGPVLESNLLKIHETAISIPNFYFKVMLEIKSKAPKAIGFVIPQKSPGSDLSKYAMSVDRVEEITGIDFFESLTDEAESEIESKSDFADW